MGRWSPWSRNRSRRGATVVPTLDVCREVAGGEHRQLRLSQCEPGSASTLVHTVATPNIPASVGKSSELSSHSFKAY
jgi:hypothetical protein